MASSRCTRRAEGSALAGLFSSGVVQQMARRGRSESFSRFARESGLASAVGGTTPVRQALDVAFDRLRREHRGEYVFKAAIAQNILLGRHSVNTAVMLTEFRVGSCKADVVILNGTSAAYEIKSDRDSLDRLPAQVSAYLQAFAQVNVITSHRHIDSVIAIVPSEVGVLHLKARGRISPVREPIGNTARIDSSTLFDSLQLNEVKKVLGRLRVQIPDAPNTRMYQTLRGLFLDLEPGAAHAAMVSTLRATRSHKGMAGLLGALPACLRAAALTTPIRKGDHARLFAALDTQMVNALRWG